jgi:biopolymer transport protein ExbD
LIMRTYRKRPWASLVVNMTPLIDVVFLIIIFFIMMINFSDILIKNVVLPRADEAKKSGESITKKISITIKSKDFIVVGRKRVGLENIDHLLTRKITHPKKCTVQLRGDENVPYSTVQKVMEEIASSGITRIEFSALSEKPLPVEKDKKNEASL